MHTRFAAGAGERATAPPARGRRGCRAAAPPRQSCYRVHRDRGPATAPRGTGEPATAWLAAVNRQSLAVRLLATSVHDVNNILQVVSGAAEVLALDPTPAAVEKRTSSIVGQSVAATAVLHELMAFVRADSAAADGARPLALAQQALAFRQHAFKKLRATASAEGDDGACTMARHHLQQVVLNLVLNAEQALVGRPGGVVRITVRGGAALVIEVEDNGTGLSEAARTTAFAWPPVAGDAAGTLGLGLLVSRRLVEAAGGTLEVEAPPSGGTRAVVTVPALAR